MFMCKFCNKGFAKETGLNMHMGRYHKQDEYTCECCGKVFARYKDLLNHQRNKKITLATKAKVYTCPLCNREFIGHKGCFTLHVRLHDPDERARHNAKISQTRREFLNDPVRSEHSRKVWSKHMKENNPMSDVNNVNKMKTSWKKTFECFSSEKHQQFVNNFINAPKKGNASKHSGKFTPTSIERVVINFEIDDLIYNGNLQHAQVIRFVNKNYKKTLVPDFIYKNNMAFIETFGNYWHPKEDEERYLNACNENNYPLLILWETEILEDPVATKKKIIKFLDTIDKDRKKE